MWSLETGDSSSELEEVLEVIGLFHRWGDRLGACWGAVSGTTARGGRAKRVSLLAQSFTALECLLLTIVVSQLFVSVPTFLQTLTSFALLCSPPPPAGWLLWEELFLLLHSPSALSAHLAEKGPPLTPACFFCHFSVTPVCAQVQCKILENRNVSTRQIHVSDMWSCFWCHCVLSPWGQLCSGFDTERGWCDLGVRWCHV